MLTRNCSASFSDFSWTCTRKLQSMPTDGKCDIGKITVAQHAQPSLSLVLEKQAAKSRQVGQLQWRGRSLNQVLQVRVHVPGHKPDTSTTLAPFTDSISSTRFNTSQPVWKTGNDFIKPGISAVAKSSGTLDLKLSTAAKKAEQILCKVS